MMIRCFIFVTVATVLTISGIEAFVTNSKAKLSVSSHSTSNLLAKKKKKRSGGKGFGKATENSSKSASSKSNSQDLFNIEARAAAVASKEASAFTSVDGGLDSIPTLSMENEQKTSLSTSENIEDRTGSILREKYGLRTREEQEAEEAKKKKLEDQRKQLNEWKQLADQGDDFDLLQIIPDPILIFIDKFLKAGVAVCTFVFILAGIAIMIEAGSKATNNPLPPQVDDFVTQVVEPNFTPGLGVLLSFSVALGLFASLQLNSAASTYREDK